MPTLDELAATGSPAAAYPTISEAATLIGVPSATLSARIPEIQGRLILGGHETRFPPHVVLALGAEYRNRDSSEIAAGLIDLAYERAPEFVAEIEGQVDVFLDAEVERAELQN